MYAAVPATLPQTSAMAEYLSFAFTAQVADRPSTLWADFKGTINAFNMTAECRLRVNQRYGGVFAFAHGMPGFQHIKDVKHVKSHRSGEEYASMDEKMQRITDGNVFVDRSAQKGAERHRKVEHDFKERMDEAEKHCANLAKLIAHILSLHSQEEERWQRNSNWK